MFIGCDVWTNGSENIQYWKSGTFYPFVELGPAYDRVWEARKHEPVFCIGFYRFIAV